MPVHPENALAAIPTRPSDSATRWMHLALTKAFTGMTFTLAGISSVSAFVPLINRFFAQHKGFASSSPNEIPHHAPTSVICTLFRAPHIPNAPPPMLVTPLGIAMLVRLEQSENALLPILVTLSGIVMFARLVHSENAPLPMLVTPAGIAISVRPVQPLNA